MGDDRQDIVGDGIRHPTKRAFLEAFARSGVVGVAAKAVDMHRSTHGKWMHEEGPEADAYREAFDQAKDAAADLLEATAINRAVRGTRRLVLHEGKPVLIENLDTGEMERLWEVKYSDTMLIFMLKAARPEKFRERYEFSGPGGGPLQLQVLRQDVRAIMADPETAEACEAMAEKLLPAAPAAIRSLMAGIDGDGREGGNGNGLADDGLGGGNGNGEGPTDGQTRSNEPG